MELDEEEGEYALESDIEEVFFLKS